MGGQAGNIDATVLLTDPNYFRFRADAVTGLRGLRSHSSPFLQQKKKTSTEITEQNRNLFNMSNNNIIFCYLVEQQNYGTKSAGPGLISDLRAGRSVFQ